LGWFSGFAAFRAESLWLSVKAAILLAATPPRRSLICINELTESQRLSAREAAKPQEQNPEAFRKTKPQRLSAREAAKPLSAEQNPRAFHK